ncbi:MAG: hypothetical protein Q9170_007670 [Blastenia crenularia]
MSKLLLVLTEAHICLRCRLRIAATGTRPPRNVSRQKRPPLRNFSVKTRRPQEHVPTNDSVTDRQDLLENPTSSTADISYETGDIKLPDDASTSRQPADAGFYFRRTQLYSKDPLGITTLGKPAEVLRLQDEPHNSVKRRWWLMQSECDETPVAMKPLTSSDIMERVLSERGLVSAAKVKENIETLKKEWLASLKEPHLPPLQSDCYELGKRMYDGFTIQQLLGYVSDAFTQVTTDLTDLNKRFSSPLLTRSSWRAGVKDFPGDAAQRLQHIVADIDNGPNKSSKEITKSTLSYESKRTKDPVKHILVNQIMRHCWSIKPREELESLGEVDVQIAETHLELMTGHERNVLRRVAEEYDAKIEFSRVDPILRITANEATCVSTLRLLSLVLNQVACYEMPLGEDASPTATNIDYRTLLNDRLLREVERLSSTVIRWMGPPNAAISSTEKLSIYYLKNSAKSLVDAQRFLEQSLRPTRDKVKGAFFGVTRALASKSISVPVEVGQTLPLADRGIAWARKILGKLDHREEAKPLPDGYIPSSALSEIRRFLQPLKAWKDIENDFEHEFWESTPYQQSSTIFGRLLYPATDTTSAGETLTSLEHITGHRVFTTELPGIRRTLEVREVKILKVEEEYRIRMIAANKVAIKESEEEDVPDLELRCFVQPDEHKISLDSARLILGEAQADLLLPYEQVDLRFATQTYIIAKELVDPRILQFVESSNIHRRGLDQVDKSQILTINLPQRILSPAKASAQADRSEMAVKYLIGSVERRSTVYGRPARAPGQQQFSLSLAMIDGGSMGGRRQEFRFFEDRALEFVRDMVTEREGGQLEKRSLIKGLYICARDTIEQLRVESRRKARPVIRSSLKRRRQVELGFRGSERGREMLLRRRSKVVRRRFTDSPIESGEAGAEKSTGNRPKRRVRRVHSARSGKK